MPDLTTDQLIESGAIVECAACGKLSAHAWCDVDEDNGIAHVGASCCWTWKCGHCRATNCDADSPILAECYTHVGPDGDDLDD